MTSTIFKVNDRVRVKDNYFNSAARGREGTITSTDVKNIFLDGLVNVKLDTGAIITLAGESLELLKTPSKEGEKIDPKDIKVGMTVKLSITTTSGDYEQVSSKQGVVSKVTKQWGVIEVWVKTDTTDVRLDYGNRNQTYTLIKDAPEVDEIAEALKDLKPGSVVQIEDDGAGQFKSTFTKSSATQGGVPLWILHESRYVYASSVSETVVRKKVTSLDQIVVKH